jgi:glycosyltransferase involved in cell wall biosynthesis
MTEFPIDFSIVIPCYNEEDRLPRTLHETLRYAQSRTGERYEIIVVSDGSKDRTKEVAEKVFQTLPDNVIARVIEYTPNRGKGQAVRVGMTEAQGKKILFMDADYAVPIEALEEANALLNNGVSVAIGSRALEDTQLHARQSFLRERFAKLFGLVQRNYLGLRLMDTQCGFKLFTKEAAHAIFPKLALSSVIFDGETLWLAKKLGYKVKEFPVEWTHDQDTRIAYTPAKAIMVILDMFKIPFLHRNDLKK